MNVRIAAQGNRNALTLGTTCCAAIVGAYLALLQTGLSAYAGVEMGASWLARSVTLIYLAAALAAGTAIVRGHVNRRTIIATAGFLTIAFVPLLLNRGEIGPVTKSYVAGMVSMVAVGVAATMVDLRRVAQFSASLVCLASVCCLLDVCFYDGFSNTAGRAAFIYINPNVAALALLLGAVASAWSIPLKWLPAFLVLVGGAVFSTLSRSAMLMGALTLAACLPAASNNWRETLREMKKGIRASIIVLIGVFLFLGVALNNNPAFPVALDDGFHGLTTIFKWLKVASLSDGSGTAASAGLPDNANTAIMIHMVEAKNSASARALLAERALRQFIHGPAMGIGLERAFAMAPHDSYLLFADAFGYVGWMIVPALVAMLYYLGGRRALPASVLLATAGFFSHDLLFAMPLVASLSLVLAFVSKKDGSTFASDQKTFPALGAIAMAITLLCISTDTLEQYQIPTYTQEYSGQDIKHVTGQEFYVPLPRIDPPGIFRLGAESKEGFAGGGIEIFENGHPLAFENRLGKDIAIDGPGRFGFHNMWALFSSTDGSDPSANGRIYRVNGSVTLHPLFLLCVLACLAWSVLYSTYAFDMFEMQARLRRKRT